MRKQISRLAVVAFGLYAVLLTAGCRTVEEPEPPAAAPPTPVEGPAPDPFLTDWAGTTWILRDSGDAPRRFPGYRGFHFGRDGRLILINSDTAVGDTWTADAGTLEFHLIEGTPELPLEGSFLALRIPGAPDDGSRFRMVPESDPRSPGIIFDRTAADIDIVENHWIPKALDGGDRVMWPMNRELHLILLPDGTGGLSLLGYGGENRFHGDVTLTADSFTPGPLAITRRIGPGSEFEDLFVRRISETTRYVQVEDDLFFYRETRPTAAFQVRLFD